MRLKKIDIKGFKSFADKTSITFPDDITVIVGPNGSGKSNISDSIRWVLGEQSVKSLRGNKMEDVIFAGTNERGQSGLAEVTITFDNKSNTLPIDYDEVAITRRVFRSGESNYYINKNICRLKDVRELFMDTGIGKEGYSIIGQGKIDEILANRPEDRRGIFEEAAGIIRYKSRKEETEKKLLKTEENLLRIDDLYIELKSHRNKLKLQANKAKSYQELYGELKLLELNYINNKLEKNKLNSVTLKSKLREIEDILINKKKLRDKFQNNLNKELTYLDKNQEKLERLNDQKFEILRANESLRNKRNILEQQKIYNQDNINRLKKEEKDSLEKTQKLYQRIKKDEEELFKKEETLLRKSKEYNKSNDKLKKHLTCLDKLKNYKKEIENKILNFKYKINKKESKIELLITEIDLIEDGSKQNISISKELYGKIDLIIKEIEEIDREVSYIEKKLLYFKEEINKIKNKKFRLDLNLKSNLSEGQEVVKKIESLTSSYRILSNMEKNYEGYFYGVKSLLKESQKNQKIKKEIIGIVADLISIEKKYQEAISTALGGTAQNIVTPNQASARKIITFLQKEKLGRVTCLPLDTIKSNKLRLDMEELNKDEYNYLGIASDLVSYNPDFKNIIENLLGRTIVVKDLKSAIKLSNRFNNSLRIVSLKGNIINPGGSMTGGSQSSNITSLISRKVEIEDIHKDIEKFRKKEIFLRSSSEKLSKEIKDLEERLNLSRSNYRKFEVDLINVMNKKENLEKEKIRLTEEKSLILSKDQLVEKRLESLYENKKSSRQKLKILKEKVLELEQNLDKTSKEINIREVEKESKFEIRTELKISLNRLDDTIQQVNQSIKNMKSEKKIMENNILENKKTIEFLKKSIVDGEIEEKETKEKILKLDNDLKDISYSIKDLRSKNNKANENLEKFNKKLETLNEDIFPLEKELKDIQLEFEKNKLKIRSLEENLEKNYDINLRNTSLFLEGNIVKNVDHDKILYLKEKIKSLGNVNLDSIEEFTKLNNRVQFMEKQKKDMLKAKDDLVKVIREIESTMSTIFKRSFNEINKNFKKIFKNLFNGGDAELILQDKNNILESGIEIEAQPPGKKLQNLNSLSGGERSLIAVSLLFAILELSPSPFCILDEIDSALDESNISRYTNYLASISKSTQFIIITHRKKTMEIGDSLYGVTMEERGVSKVISTKLT